MYNLLISGAEDSWDGEPLELSRSRVFEYTDEAISTRFKELNAEQLALLYEMPALFAYERGRNKAARVGSIVRVRIRQRDVRIEYEFRDAIPEIPHETIEQLKWALDIEDFEVHRTHWAVKDVDLIDALHEAGLELGGAELVPEREVELIDLPVAVAIPVQPKVFRIPDEPRDPNLVAIMGPFDAAFDAMFRAVDRAANEAGLVSLNARQVWEAEEIIQDVFSLIYRSRMVVCDFSGQNANVFYEAGIAHTLGKVVIPIAQSIEDLPFDLRHHRALIYRNDEGGFEQLVQTLSARIGRVAAAPQ